VFRGQRSGWPIRRGKAGGEPPKEAASRAAEPSLGPHGGHLPDRRRSPRFLAPVAEPVISSAFRWGKKNLVGLGDLAEPPLRLLFYRPGLTEGAEGLLDLLLGGIPRGPKDSQWSSGAEDHREIPAPATLFSSSMAARCPRPSSARPGRGESPRRSCGPRRWRRSSRASRCLGAWAPTAI
jgi:hypothetical protein